MKIFEIYVNGTIHSATTHEDEHKERLAKLVANGWNTTEDSKEINA